MNTNVMIVLYAVIAAFGNALVSYGQKKAAPVHNLYFFLGTAAFVFFVCNIIAGVVVKADSPSCSKMILTDPKELFWAIICGIALFILYFAINNLLVGYGASMYVVYSVISVFFTSIIVGVFIFREKINVWHVLGIIVSCLAVALITIGNSRK